MVIILYDDCTGMVKQIVGARIFSKKSCLARLKKGFSIFLPGRAIILIVRKKFDGAERMKHVFFLKTKRVNL